MKGTLTRIALGVLAVLGLYVTVIVGMFAAGLILGFATTSPPKPHVTIQYIHCDDAHPSPECAMFPKSAPGLAPTPGLTPTLARR